MRCTGRHFTQWRYSLLACAPLRHVLCGSALLAALWCCAGVALARLGTEPQGSGPVEFGGSIKSENTKYSKVIRDAGINVD